MSRKMKLEEKCRVRIKFELKKKKNFAEKMKKKFR